jgi:type I restriction enzyme, S subunit
MTKPNRLKRKAMENEESDLPKGWCIRRLDEICRFRSGGTPPKNDRTLWAGSLPWVSGKDLKRPRLADSIDHITEEAAHAFSEIAPAGAVLALVRGMGLVNAFAVSLIDRPMAFNQDLKALIPSPDVSGAFLVHALTFASRRMLRNVTDAAHGTKRLSQDDLRAFEVPVPTIAEQSAIAEVLDRLVAAIDAETQGLKTAERLKAVAMRELFTRGLHGETQTESQIGVLPGDWEICTIADHFALSSGGTPSRANPSYWSGGQIPWVKTGEVNYRVITTTEEHITEQGLKDSAAKLLPAGTLLMAMYGQGITRGKVAMLGIAACCNQACAAFRPLDNLIDPEFLYYYLSHSYEAIRRFSHGGQQQNLNMDIVGAFRVAYPPSNEEQRGVVQILKAIDEKIEIHGKKRAVLNELFKALLHKLMTAEIRVTDLDLTALQQKTSEVLE